MAKLVVVRNQRSFSCFGGLFIFICVVQTISWNNSCMAAKLGLSSHRNEYQSNSFSRPNFVDVPTNAKESSMLKANDSNGFSVSLYPWNDHLGRELKMTWTAEEASSNSCQEIPVRWYGKVRSINSYGNCVILFSRQGCQGTHRIVKPGSPSHNRLSDVCFHRRTISLRPCKPDEEIST